MEIKNWQFSPDTLKDALEQEVASKQVELLTAKDGVGQIEAAIAALKESITKLTT